MVGCSGGDTHGMQIPKELILQLLMQRGQNDHAAQAEQELPGQVDTEQHGDLLSRFGLNAGDLMGLVGGGGGGGGGGPLGDIKGKLGL